MKPLFQVGDMPWIQGVRIPQGFYVVIDEPAPLAGMFYPDGTTPWKDLYTAGFRHVARLANDNFHYDPAPLHLLRTPVLEDLHHGNMPRDPGVEEKRVREVVNIVLDRIKNGEGVVVHCIGGTGRTGMVIGCTLKALGYAGGDVLGYLDRLNKMRGKRGWPESPWQAGMVERF